MYLGRGRVTSCVRGGSGIRASPCVGARPRVGALSYIRARSIVGADSRDCLVCGHIARCEEFSCDGERLW